MPEHGARAPRASSGGGGGGRESWEPTHDHKGKGRPALSDVDLYSRSVPSVTELDPFMMDKADWINWLSCIALSRVPKLLKDTHVTERGVPEILKGKEEE